MLDMLVLATTPQDPGTFCHYVKEMLTRTSARAALEPRRLILGRCRWLDYLVLFQSMSTTEGLRLR